MQTLNLRKYHMQTGEIQAKSTLPGSAKTISKILSQKTKKKKDANTICGLSVNVLFIAF